MTNKIRIKGPPTEAAKKTALELVASGAAWRFIAALAGRDSWRIPSAWAEHRSDWRHIARDYLSL
jgi:hypothetical protein